MLETKQLAKYENADETPPPANKKSVFADGTGKEIISFPSKRLIENLGFYLWRPCGPKEDV